MAFYTIFFLSSQFRQPHACYNSSTHKKLSGQQTPHDLVDCIPQQKTIPIHKKDQIKTNKNTHELSLLPRLLVQLRRRCDIGRAWDAWWPMAWRAMRYEM